MIRIERPPPKPLRYHYSDKSSQGSIITETANFPDEYDESEFYLRSEYSDRLSVWDFESFKKACEFLKCGSQGWPAPLQKLDDSGLRYFAQLLYNVKPSGRFHRLQTPLHVRAIYCFNVGTGYDCPVIQSIYERTV